MRALSLTQPWASLVMDERKHIETRSWPMPSSLIGKEVAIHAAKSIDKEACRDFGYDPETIPRGCILGTVEMGRSFQFSEETVWPISKEEQRYGDFYFGRWGFPMYAVKRFSVPIPARGALGFWEWPRLSQPDGKEGER
jgi:activating signal cointegrator 1